MFDFWEGTLDISGGADDSGASSDVSSVWVYVVVALASAAVVVGAALLWRSNRKRANLSSTESDKEARESLIENSARI